MSDRPAHGWLSLAIATCPVSTLAPSATPKGREVPRSAGALRDYLAGRLAARCALQQAVPQVCPVSTQIGNDPKGAPYFLDHRAFLTITHDSGIGASAVSVEAVCGIDIERWQIFEEIELCAWGYPSPFIKSLAAQQRAPTSWIKCALWVATEALGKSLGSGIGIIPHTLQISSLERSPWAWQAHFTHFPHAVAYVWLTGSYMTGVLMHGYRLADPQELGDWLNAAFIRSSTLESGASCCAALLRHQSVELAPTPWLLP
ncbi:hypothetical protein C4K03_2398 [Pseudomonas synxantha]|uniref:Uncharacterized protein n=1 Tax=Pseudomonas synxantha TaxID=47883 RepID=A0A3G7U5B1_9PSED|nr:hypothetical protein C4K03_2398 [Pseudomonas synxantha]